MIEPNVPPHNGDVPVNCDGTTDISPTSAPARFYPEFESDVNMRRLAAVFGSLDAMEREGKLPSEALVHIAFAKARLHAVKTLLIKTAEQRAEELQEKRLKSLEAEIDSLRHKLAAPPLTYTYRVRIS